MKVYLASTLSFVGPYLTPMDIKGIYGLESFYYLKPNQEKYIGLFKEFLLDSGAYTFFFSKKTQKVNWEEYVDRYADFINRNNVKHFFELDIDKLIGYENVLILRRKLEHKTGKQCIPVWHTNRGKQEYEKMCQEYNYVAIGGLVGGGGASSEYAKKYWNYFPYFINTAHKNETKIHGLGFTSPEGLQKYDFDSVDSTSWLAGNRFGSVMRFDGEKIVTYTKKQGQRMKNARGVLVNNFREYVKFQKYADIKL